ncbi:MAG TPA: hypothetical protein VFZ78_01505 [Flavisolibacter sp.]
MGKIIYFNCIMILLISCAYEAPDCEKWEIRDDEYVNVNPPCGINWACGGSRTMQLTFCGESLEDAKAGNTINLNNDPCCRKTRTFIRRVD